uniref:Putative secreted protein n=1 Tax=Anopheles darlingi TaxID=43151 RepID=A0A2M4DH21_ANODA
MLMLIFWRLAFISPVAWPPDGGHSIDHMMMENQYLVTFQADEWTANSSGRWAMPKRLLSIRRPTEGLAGWLGGDTHARPSGDPRSHQAKSRLFLLLLLVEAPSPHTRTHATHH